MAADKGKKDVTLKYGKRELLSVCGQSYKCYTIVNCNSIVVVTKNG